MTLTDTSNASVQASICHHISNVCQMLKFQQVNLM